MRENIVVSGIVLDTSQLKEYDKRLVILTAELGRITVFANGARKKNSPFTAASQKFVMGNFTIRPSHTAYTLVSVEIKDSFRELSLDLEKMSYASYACEIMDYFTEEGLGAKNELNLLYVTFKALIAGKLPLSFIKSVFELKELELEGYGLEMTRCVRSGVETNLNHISLEEGGLLCDAVTPQVHGARLISEGAIYGIRLILSKDLNSLYSFSVPEGTQSEMEKLASDYLKIHTDRKFKSLDIISSLM